MESKGDVARRGKELKAKGQVKCIIIIESRTSVHPSLLFDVGAIIIRLGVLADLRTGDAPYDVLPNLLPRLTLGLPFAGPVSTCAELNIRICFHSTF